MCTAHTAHTCGVRACACGYLFLVGLVRVFFCRLFFPSLCCQRVRRSGVWYSFCTKPNGSHMRTLLTVRVPVTLNCAFSRFMARFLSVVLLRTLHTLYSVTWCVFLCVRYPSAAHCELCCVSAREVFNCRLLHSLSREKCTLCVLIRAVLALVTRVVALLGVSANFEVSCLCRLLSPPLF